MQLSLRKLKLNFVVKTEAESNRNETGIKQERILYHAEQTGWVLYPVVWAGTVLKPFWNRSRIAGISESAQRSIDIRDQQGKLTVLEYIFESNARQADEFS